MSEMLVLTLVATADVAGIGSMLLYPKIVTQLVFFTPFGNVKSLLGKFETGLQIVENNINASMIFQVNQNSRLI